MSANLDLLRPAAPVETAPRRRSSSSFVVGALVLGALGWAFVLVKPSLFPARRVSSALVRVVTGPARSAASVEATGWIEPDPFPVLVRPLVDGTVERFEVVEGQAVRANETVLARMRSSMIEGELEKMRTMVAHKEAHLPEVQADLDEAKGLLEQRLELRRELARLDGRTRGGGRRDRRRRRRREGGGRPRRVRARRTRGAGGVAGRRERLRRPDRARAARRSRSRAPSSRRSPRRWGRRRRRGRRSKPSSNWRARRWRARSRSRRRSRGRRRTSRPPTPKSPPHAPSATSPSARPAGSSCGRRSTASCCVATRRRGLRSGRRACRGAARAMSAEPSEGTLLSLYDPASLQARIDVPVGSVGGIGAGRRVELTAEALPGRTFHGSVTRVLSQADPLKNTLQVKVRIEDPDPLLKPEMLARARFLAVDAAPGTASGAVRILVPDARRARRCRVRRRSDRRRASAPRPRHAGPGGGRLDRGRGRARRDPARDPRRRRGRRTRWRCRRELRQPALRHEVVPLEGRDRHAARVARPRHREGRVRGADGAVGQRQDHAAPPDRRHRPTDVGHDRRRGRARSRRCRRGGSRSGARATWASCSSSTTSCRC